MLSASAARVVQLLTVQSAAQEYIENENARLEREQQFWAKEIVVKIEYKYCPNLTIIDTPGRSSTPAQMPGLKGALLTGAWDGCARPLGRNSVHVSALGSNRFTACFVQRRGLGRALEIIQLYACITGVFHMHSHAEQAPVRAMRLSTRTYAPGLISTAPGRRNSTLQNSPNP